MSVAHSPASRWSLGVTAAAILVPCTGFVLIRAIAIGSDMAAATAVMTILLALGAVFTLCWVPGAVAALVALRRKEPLRGRALAVVAIAPLIDAIVLVIAASI